MKIQTGLRAGMARDGGATSVCRATQWEYPTLWPVNGLSGPKTWPPPLAEPDYTVRRQP
jgi:hypothetical protein